MTGRHTRLIALAVLATVVLSTASCAPQDSPEPEPEPRPGVDVKRLELFLSEGSSLVLIEAGVYLGDAGAEFALGVRYAEGRGVPQNDAEAIKWLLRAASQGDPELQWRLGERYYSDSTVPEQNFAEAVRWFQMAAEQGHVNAQLELGRIYLDGNLVPKDYVQAHMWYNLAASKATSWDYQTFEGSTVPVEYERGIEIKEWGQSIVKSRDAVAALMTPEELSEAQQKAFDWLPVPDHE